MLQTSVTGNVINVSLTGKITTEEYDRFEAELKELSKTNESYRIFADATGMKGAEAHVVWDDLMNLGFYKNVDKFAVVGDKGWQQIVAKLTTLLVKGEVRYFDGSEIEQARAWIKE